jgi:hypothetical protein
MPRMIDLIRASAVPATLIQSAARGALALPADEMIEILVHLATENKVHGDQARLTLAGWEEKSALAVAFNPNTPVEVLQYLIAPENLRPKLLPALLENPAVPEHALIELAGGASKEVVEAMQASPRVNRLPAVRDALASNPHYEGGEACEEVAAEAAPDSILAGPSNPEQQSQPEEDMDEEISAYLNQHAAEIAAEGDKPFQPIGGIEVLDLSEAAAPIAAAGATAQPAASDPSAPAAHQHVRPKPQEDDRRGSTLQKIARLDIKGRIQLAMKGNKEERSILIRDGTKLVAVAVLDSPKISDGEVEGFASQKNVLEAVLRAIPMKRRFAKHYPVVRNLVFNPRTPLDLSLGLMKNLLVNDLRNLASNKEVSETIRKLALKMFKQKLDPTKKG